MRILHLQRLSAFDTNDFMQCLLTLNNEDAIVMMDDGCYCLQHSLILKFKCEHPNVIIYYVKDHADARAITLVDNTPIAINMTTLVDLTFEYDSVITWQ